MRSKVHTDRMTKTRVNGKTKCFLFLCMAHQGNTWRQTENEWNSEALSAFQSMPTSCCTTNDIGDRKFDGIENDVSDILILLKRVHQQPVLRKIFVFTVESDADVFHPFTSGGFFIHSRREL